MNLKLKKIIGSISLFILLSNFSFSQKMDHISIEKRLTAIEDRTAIKFLVDEFSNLADSKEIDKQVLLFTEDGIVESISKGQAPSLLKGREQLKNAFTSFLSNFHTVYHQNGQQNITLLDNKAEATSYCRVILVGLQNGKEMKTTLYTIYKDLFVKEQGKWLIQHRTSNFVFREVEELK